MKTITLRPHHLICCLCFSGHGYNENFTNNLATICKAIRSNSVNIKIVEGCDDICEICPNKYGTTCQKETIVRSMDRTYQTILELENQQAIDFPSLKKQIKNHLSLDDFHKTCRNCSWYSLNLCAPIIRHLLSEHQT